MRGKCACLRFGALDFPRGGKGVSALASLGVFASLWVANPSKWRLPPRHLPTSAFGIASEVKPEKLSQRTTHEEDTAVRAVSPPSVYRSKVLSGTYL